MPFTPSHAVVALPFVRTPLVPAAIAIGAMTPDLPLFLRGPLLPAGIAPSYGFTHAPGNIVATALVALALLLLWRVLLRPAAVELAPAWIANRLPGEWGRTGFPVVRETLLPGGRWTGALLLAVSLVLGVLSHILWDLFTHEGRAGTEILPVLARSWGPLPGYTWLQHGSSVIGLLVLGVYALLWWRRRPRAVRVRRTPPWVRRCWWLSLPLTLLGAWIIGFATWGPFTDDFTIAHLGYRVLPGAVGLWGLATVLLCVVVLLLPTRPARETP